MGKSSLVRQLFPALVSITLIALFAASWDAMTVLRHATYAEIEGELEARARLLQPEISAPLASNPAALQPLCRSLGRSANTRITVILPSGKVLADSESDPARMDNHGDRPEVIDALSGRRGSAVRYSYTLGVHMMYVAVPLRSNGRIVGALRTATSVGHIDNAVAAIRDRIFLGAGVVAALAIAASWLVAQRFARPWREMRGAAERFAAGDLAYRVPLLQDSAEARGLADAMNEMAEQLHDRLHTLDEQRNRQEALLASMVEGVLAVDADERVITLNRAAAEMFRVNPVETEGRALPEAIRNPSLQRLVSQALAGNGLIEGEVVLREGADRFLQGHGTVLRNAQGKRIGALIVLNDVTRLRRLETVRRDFVANVSHELRTPITAIQGFVEALREGALDDREHAERFLEIIAKQSHRLDAIIEDLLTLSRIEQGAERDEITLEEGPICDALRAAVQACQGKADERDMRVNVLCDETLTARLNLPLLEQAIANLLDNAIKYGNAGGNVWVEGRAAAGEFLIEVRDEGPGIAPQHLPRIFERFYRVEKARSRSAGGTGLGLAIVKHIAQAHGGRVTVESTLGQGSAFAIRLPRE